MINFLANVVAVLDGTLHTAEEIENCLNLWRGYP